MAASVITSSSAASVTFGATAETGIILSSFNRSVQGQKAELMDEDGDIVAISTYGRTATISISGAIASIAPWRFTVKRKPEAVSPCMPRPRLPWAAARPPAAHCKRG
jgi:hypothetical protein